MFCIYAFCTVYNHCIHLFSAILQHSLFIIIFILIAISLTTHEVVLYCNTVENSVEVHQCSRILGLSYHVCLVSDILPVGSPHKSMFEDGMVTLLEGLLPPLDMNLCVRGLCNPIQCFWTSSYDLHRNFIRIND